MKRKRSLAILDVGHGNCAVLVDTNGVVVIDAGPGTGLLEFLEDQDVRLINVVLLSHADKDHISGLLALLAANTVTVDQICLNTDSLKQSQLWDDLLFELNALRRAGKVDFQVALVEDTSGQYDQGPVRVEILAPSAYLAGKGAGGKDRQRRKLTTNSMSAVIRLVQNGKPIALFTGDMDDVGLDNLIRSNNDVKAPVLVFPHHGGRACRDMPGFVKALLESTRATTVVFSVGRGEPKHPDPTVVAAVRKYSAKARIACTQLSEHCAQDTPSAQPSHLNGIFSRGREDNACCVGSMLIDLAKSDEVLPAARAHEAYVRKVAPSAMCGCRQPRRRRVDSGRSV